MKKFFAFSFILAVVASAYAQEGVSLEERYHTNTLKKLREARQMQSSEPVVSQGYTQQQPIAAGPCKGPKFMIFNGSVGQLATVCRNESGQIQIATYANVQAGLTDFTRLPDKGIAYAVGPEGFMLRFYEKDGLPVGTPEVAKVFHADFVRSATADAVVTGGYGGSQSVRFTGTKVETDLLSEIPNTYATLEACRPIGFSARGDQFCFDMSRGQIVHVPSSLTGMLVGQKYDVANVSNAVRARVVGNTLFVQTYPQYEELPAPPPTASLCMYIPTPVKTPGRLYSIQLDPSTGKEGEPIMLANNVQTDFAAGGNIEVDGDDVYYPAIQLNRNGEYEGSQIRKLNRKTKIDQVWLPARVLFGDRPYISLFKKL